MAMTKVTYTLDDDTVELLKRSAAQQRKAQSLVVREAIAEYAARVERLSESERSRMLEVLARVRASAPERPAAEVEQELRVLKTARRRGGRRTKTP
jgi:predicted transcriptional regulator